MGYAVELYFDAPTEKRVWDLRHALIAQGIKSTITELGDRPHISLAVFPDVDCAVLLPITQAFASKMESFNFQSSAIGLFPTAENVLFLSPAPTQQLLACHQAFHQRLAQANLTPSPYYVPANWTPHCTVEMNIPDGQMAKAVSLCKNSFKPLFGQVCEIGVVEFRPIKHLANWSLGS